MQKVRKLRCTDFPLYTSETLLANIPHEIAKQQRMFPEACTHKYDMLI